MQFVKFAKIVAGIVAFLGALFGIIQFFRDVSARVAKLQAAVVNVEHVSAHTTIPNLKITLAFKEQPVADLWLCRVRFQNTGGVTLYTTGSKPNTQNPIQLMVSPNYEILLIEPKGIDPKDSGFDAQIRQSQDDKGVPDKHQFEVHFDQWRKDEAIEAVLYLSSSGENMAAPTLIPKGRPILDGDIVPTNLSEVASPEVKRLPYLEKVLSPFWALVVRLFAILTLTISGMWLVLRDIWFKKTSRLAWQQEHPNFMRSLELVLFLGIYAALFAMIR